MQFAERALHFCISCLASASLKTEQANELPVLEVLGSALTIRLILQVEPLVPDPPTIAGIAVGTAAGTTGVLTVMVEPPSYVGATGEST